MSRKADGSSDYIDTTNAAFRKAAEVPPAPPRVLPGEAGPWTEGGSAWKKAISPTAKPYRGD